MSKGLASPVVVRFMPVRYDEFQVSLVRGMADCVTSFALLASILKELLCVLRSGGGRVQSKTLARGTSTLKQREASWSAPAPWRFEERRG